MISLNSTITAKLLNYFFINHKESLYVNELSRKLGLDKRNLVKKLKELESEGIFTSQTRGNLKLYSINRKYPLYKEYKKIIVKTLGLEANLRETLRDVKGIKQAYIYGSYAANKLKVHSDIDLLVVGRQSVIETQKAIRKIQKEIDREMNIVNMGEAEFRRRKKNKDPFLSNIFSGKTIKII